MLPGLGNEALCGTISSERGENHTLGRLLKDKFDEMGAVAERVAVLVVGQGLPAVGAMSLANFAEHLLMWSLRPLREMTPELSPPPAGRVVRGVAGGGPASEALEAVWLPHLIARCAKQQLSW